MLPGLMEKASASPAYRESLTAFCTQTYTGKAANYCLWAREAGPRLSVLVLGTLQWVFS